MKVLIPNLGSTSLKYQLLETENETVLARGKIDRIGGAESQIDLLGDGERTGVAKRGACARSSRRHQDSARPPRHPWEGE